MKVFKFRDIKFLAEDKGGVYAFLAKYKGRNIVYKCTDETLYDDVDSNPRRSRAARSFVYEKIKHMFYVSVNSDIVVGGWYECIKDVVMNDTDGQIFYHEGKKYRSDQSGCITDELGHIEHYWDSDFNEYFKYVQD